MSDIKKSELWAGFTYIAALFLALGAVSHLAGCSSNIPLPGEEPDVCATEGVEDCCLDCDPPVDCVPISRAAYERGFRDGVDSVVCETPEPTCPDDEDSDCDEDTHKNVHKHCRGKGHHSALRCDKNCDPDDPICIPCDLEPVAWTVCRTICNALPSGQMECTRQCWVDGVPA